MSNPGDSASDNWETWETVPKRYGGRLVYMWFWYAIKHTFILDFLLVLWSFCQSWETICTMKNFSTFLDMRRYKNWAHKISSWVYLTIWRPVLAVFLEQRVPHFFFQPSILRECWRSAVAAAHDLILLEVIWQVPMPIANL